MKKADVKFLIVEVVTRLRCCRADELHIKLAMILNDHQRRAIFVDSEFDFPDIIDEMIASGDLQREDIWLKIPDKEAVNAA